MATVFRTSAREAATDRHDFEYIYTPVPDPGGPDRADGDSAADYQPSMYTHVFPYPGDRVVVFNALNSATVICGGEFGRAVSRCLRADRVDARELDSKLLACLLTGGFVVPVHMDERDVVRRRLAKGRSGHDRLTLTIAPTMGCNFNCQYCVEPEVFRRAVNRMGPEVQDAVVALVERELEDGSVRSVAVNWFGGEPLLAVDVLADLSHRMLERCRAAGVAYHAGVTTNGYSLRKDAVDRLASCEIRFLKISLDGPAHIHDERRPLRSGRGTFERILENIQHACTTLPVVIRVNVDTHNAEALRELLDVLERAGLGGKISVYSAIVERNEAVESTYTAFASRAGFARADHVFTIDSIRRGFAQHALPRPPEHFCSADIQRSHMIGPDGELYACWGDFGDPSKRVGSLLPISETNQAYRRQYTEFDPSTHPKCSDCRVMPLCLGGCSRERLYTDEPQCGVYKFNLEDRVRAYVDHWLAGRTP